ncbi:MAG: geranylgeranylglyceryl/heptaprenylglyceryl phosphate synthase [Bacteroidia bacterium]
MFKTTIFNTIKNNIALNKKQLAVLIDPDKLTLQEVSTTIDLCNISNVDYIFYGGSILYAPSKFDLFLNEIKKLTQIPVLLFPGSSMQVSKYADGILLLSLISGRNPEYLIGQHVIAAPYLKESKIEILPTGYILIESGKSTTVSYISNTFPIPSNKPEIAACTALAGEMLGLKLIYLDGGSGAENCIPSEIISHVKKTISCPLIIGGGINSVEKAVNACNAGADIIVVGNAVEKSPGLINDISVAISKL